MMVLKLEGCWIFKSLFHVVLSNSWVDAGKVWIELTNCWSSTQSLINFHQAEILICCRFFSMIICKLLGPLEITSWYGEDGKIGIGACFVSVEVIKHSIIRDFVMGIGLWWSLHVSNQFAFYSFYVHGDAFDVFINPPQHACQTVEGIVLTQVAAYYIAVVVFTITVITSL